MRPLRSRANPAFVRRGSSKSVLASGCAMKLAACCCTRRYSVICSGRWRLVDRDATERQLGGLPADGLRARLPR